MPICNIETTVSSEKEGQDPKQDGGHPSTVDSSGGVRWWPDVDATEFIVFDDR